VSFDARDVTVKSDYWRAATEMHVHALVVICTCR
jgi:hypothetical protein